MRRRLTAILAADVVGYSRLVRADEDGAIEALKALRTEIIAPKLDQHGGRIVKLMGDGMLVEFTSVVEAVRAGIEAQLAVGERNARLPAEKQIMLRIGINLGDVVVDGDDIYGDGVNVATRLEGLAEPGGLCIAGSVYDQVRDHKEFAFADMGERQVKNIDRPVRVWRWSPAEAAVPWQIDARASRAPADKPAIAVLPFDNMSGDAAQEYFVDGITEDIITALARCRWLRVVARNSSFSYKGKSADVRTIAGELNVRYLLEGSVRRQGDRVRVTAQLVDGRHGTRLWGERYDSDVEDVFALQEEIARLIAGTIEPELSAIEGAALRDRPTRDLNAWDCYQRGLWHLYRFAEGELEIAKDLFERAIQLDASFAQAYARLAYVHIQLGFYGRLEDRAERIKDAVAFAKTAVDLDDREPATRVSLGRALSLCGAAERGVEELRAATELDPSFAQAHFALAQVLCYLDRPEEALPEIHEALRLSPRDPHLWTFLHVRALAHYISGNLGQAEADARAALRQPNTTFWPALVLVAILGQSGKTAEAREAIATLHRFRLGMTCADALRECTFGDRRVMTQRFMDQFSADLRKAGLPH